ncbi:MAG: hypothetical protein M5U34_42330 [Chloroflexi bacterium]|nr:hypothetical protein [Chloroflexota bacterium]
MYQIILRSGENCVKPKRNVLTQTASSPQQSLTQHPHRVGLANNGRSPSPSAPEPPTSQFTINYSQFIISFAVLSHQSLSSNKSQGRSRRKRPFSIR